MARRPSSETSSEACDDQKYRQYLEERRLLIDAEREQATAYAKYVLFLSSGALALSLTFVQQVAASPRPRTYPLLVLAWFSFAFAIGFTLTSMLLSQKALRHQRDINDEAMNRCDWPPTQHTRLSRWVAVLNWISLSCFFAGAFLLSVFGALNLSW
jgi:hypothetical protein